MRLLLEAGANKYALVSKEDKSARTPMNYALLSGNLEAAKVLIEEYGYDVNYVGYKEQKMPLDDACRSGSDVIVKYILDCGASVILAPNAIFKAVRFPRSLALLIAYGASIDVRKKHSISGRKELHKDDKNVCMYSYKSGAQPLHYAAAACSIKAIQILLDAGAHREARDRSGRTPLYLLQQQIDYRVQASRMTPRKQEHFNKMVSMLSKNPYSMNYVRK
jgi:ankyrin repeat protein